MKAGARRIKALRVADPFCSRLVSGEYEVDFKFFKALGGLYDAGLRASDVGSAIAKLKEVYSSFDSIPQLLEAILQLHSSSMPHTDAKSVVCNVTFGDGI
jgi:hypothetical protein